MAYAPPWVSPGQTPLENVGSELVSAAAAGVRLNLMKQQVQGKLADLALKNQQLEWRNEQMGRAFEEKQRQNDIMNTFREENLQRQIQQGDQRLWLTGVMDKFRIDRDNETMSDVGSAAQALGSINLAPDDPKRISAIWDIIHHNARAAKAMPGLFKDAFDNYNHSARSTTSKWSSDYNDYIKDVRNSVGSENLVYNLVQWKKDRWEDAQGNPIPAPWGDQKPRPGDHLSDKWYATIPSGDPTKPATTVTLPSAKILDLNRRARDLDERKMNLPGQTANEYSSPQSGSLTGAGELLPLPQDKADMQAGKTYRTNRGPARWDGERLHPVYQY